MKRVIVLFALILNSCTPDAIIVEPAEKVQECYKIIAWTDSNKGDSITILLAPYVNKIYSVKDYQDYLNKKEICDLSTIK